MELSGAELVGNCAEWIIELPLIGELADYGEVFFSSCEAYTAAVLNPDGTTKIPTTIVGGGTGDNINLVPDPVSGKILSQGTLITPTIIQCSYVGAQP